MATPNVIIESINAAHLVDYFASDAVKSAERALKGIIQDAVGEALVIRKALAVFLFFEAKKRKVVSTISAATKAVIYEDAGAWALVKQLSQMSDSVELVGLSFLELQSVCELAYGRRCAKLDVDYLAISGLIS